MRTLLLIAAFALTTASWAAKPALKISISAPARGEAYGTPGGWGRQLWIGSQEDQFQVVIENVSSRTLSVFADGNSWGDMTLSFLLTGQDGKTVNVLRQMHGYSRNAPIIVILEPGECWVRPVRYSPLASYGWKGWPEPRRGEKIKVSLVAVLEQRAEKWDKPNTVWTGKVVSKPIEVTFESR